MYVLDSCHDTNNHWFLITNTIKCYLLNVNIPDSYGKCHLKTGSPCIKQTIFKTIMLSHLVYCYDAYLEHNAGRSRKPRRTMQEQWSEIKILKPKILYVRMAYLLAKTSI